MINLKDKKKSQKVKTEENYLSAQGFTRLSFKASVSLRDHVHHRGRTIQRMCCSKMWTSQPGSRKSVPHRSFRYRKFSVLAMWCLSDSECHRLLKIGFQCEVQLGKQVVSILINVWTIFSWPFSNTVSERLSRLVMEIMTDNPKFRQNTECNELELPTDALKSALKYALTFDQPLWKRLKWVKVSAST